MNRDDIIEMAKEAGWKRVGPNPETGLDLFPVLIGKIERFAALVADAARGDYHEGWEEGYKAGVIAEREACAKICDETRYTGYVPAEDGGARQYYDAAAEECAERIRARGEA